MVAEPVPIVPMDDGNFTTGETTRVTIGPCACPGRPHDEDVAEVLVELPWDALIAIGALEGAATEATDVSTMAMLKAKAYRQLVVSGLAAWNLVDALGMPVPVAAVVRLRQERLDAIARAVNVAYERANGPLPNAPGAPSRRSRRASAPSPNPTIRPRAKRGR